MLQTPEMTEVHILPHLHQVTGLAKKCNVIDGTKVPLQSLPNMLSPERATILK